MAECELCKSMGLPPDHPEGEERNFHVIQPGILQYLPPMPRMRTIPCRGCPTVECTCFTELEQELLEKLNRSTEDLCGGSTQ